MIVLFQKRDKPENFTPYCSLGSMPWQHCQKIVGLEYWIQLLFNFTPANVRQV